MDGHGLGQAKTKRARTSFKHHQLRIMKAHFQINQNPDSRELKMLSQKTGLDKKVLQVSYRDRFFCPVTPFVSHTSRQLPLCGTIIWGPSHKVVLAYSVLTTGSSIHLLLLNRAIK